MSRKERIAEQNKKAVKRYYLKNKEVRKKYGREYGKNYYLKNKEARKEYLLKNKETIKEYQKKYQKEYQKEYYNKNCQYIKKRCSSYAKEHVQEINLRSRLRRYKLKISGSHTLGEWETLKAQYNWTCPACGKTELEIKLTEDHIIPLSKGGSNNIENIQPLCGPCNSKKSTKIIIYSPEEEINILLTEE